jgi:hypothetical protein
MYTNTIMYDKNQHDARFTFCFIPINNLYVFRAGKGKAIPLQALTGPEGSRRLRLPDFKTIGTWRW